MRIRAIQSRLKNLQAGIEELAGRVQGALNCPDRSSREYPGNIGAVL
jgi:hypothetical protein